MGGVGSGSWYRWDKKTTTGEVRRVDIRYLRKRGFLQPGCAGTLSWSRGGEPTGFINYRTHADRMVLNYRYRAYDEDWQGVEEVVWFDRTQCHYGGERLWFQCPHCGRRVAVLYGLGKRFLCRHCCQLTYSSQQENTSDRMMRKARKIRERLGASDSLFDPICQKPKGMHWKTFKRLVREEQQANEASMLTLAPKLRELVAEEFF